MASVLTCANFILLIVHGGFCHSVFIKDGEQPPLKIFHHSCALKKDEGPCKAVLDRFYFDTDTRRCERFEYGGCQGNENNFETLEECEDMCLVKANKSPCHLEDEPGPCRGLVPRYFFNSKLNECKRFFYGGCFGNANNFPTLKECQDRCQRNDTKEQMDPPKPEKKIVEAAEATVIKTDTLIKTDEYTEPQIQLRPELDPEFTPPDLCLSPVKKGHCNSEHKRFYFDPSTNRCSMFLYSGCGGNKNRFSSKRRCLMTCTKDGRRDKQIRIKTKLSNILFRAI
ncbi:tissue factor pathway inhibitor a isoform X2 [Trichomycterus rosablanca]|uniref:tissue factor pathway inhibitor a isoform X2 n=1 Tax=Trichomycterus rosablanca TaxID=2290929 RepID=UPI002F35BE8B